MTMNVYQRVAEVMKEPAAAYVKKNKQIGDGKYAYMTVTHDAITAAVRPLFIKHGIVMTVSLIEGTTVDTGKKQGAAGLPVFRFDGLYEVAFVNIDDPNDRIVERVYASGDDTADKAPGKAQSYAAKGGIMKLLMIETGENDESRIPDGDGDTKPPLKAPQSKSGAGAVDKATGEVASTVASAGQIKWLENNLANSGKTLAEAKAQFNVNGEPLSDALAKKMVAWAKATKPTNLAEQA